ncbi:hypothetical protein [Nocardia xishanensis]
MGELERRDRRLCERADRTVDRERRQTEQRDTAVDQFLDIPHVLRRILATRANRPKNHHRTSSVFENGAQSANRNRDLIDATDGYHE